MDQKSLKLLEDILHAIEEIEQFMEGVDSISVYENSPMVQRAVERDLGIVGEAANQFRKINGDDFIEDIREIVKFRNHLIHAYAYVDMEIIWSIVHDDLPRLKTEVQNLLP